MKDILSDDILTFEEITELAKADDNATFIHKIFEYNQKQLISLVIRLFAILTTEMRCKR